MSLTVEIKKKLGTFSLDLCFQAQPKEVFAILGKSGCGKSLALKCIAGIEKPDSGRIVSGGRVLFCSKDKINLSPQKRNVGYLFQQYALFPNLNVEQNIAFGIKTKHDYQKIVQEKVGEFALQGHEKKFPSQLSGGQQQRLALARIFASSPEILMLDEPFSALDSLLAWQMEREIVKHIQNFRGKVLFVSHNRKEVYRVCEKVLMLENGKAQPACSVFELFNFPKTKSALLMSGCKNISQTKSISQNVVFCFDWGFELFFENQSKLSNFVGIRANKIRFVEKREEKNCFVAHITQIVEDIDTFIVGFFVNFSFKENIIYSKISKTDFSTQNIKINQEHFVCFEQTALIFVV